MNGRDALDALATLNLPIQVHSSTPTPLVCAAYRRVVMDVQQEANLSA